MINRTLSFKLQATFREFIEEQSFKIVFNEDVKEEEAQPEVQEEKIAVAAILEENKVEDEAESTDASNLQPGAIGWDGWKILLSQMDLGFDLPPRNTDPNFVPVPPKVSFRSISVTGEAEIKFSKPVFTFDDLKTR